MHEVTYAPFNLHQFPPFNLPHIHLLRRILSSIPPFPEHSSGQFHTTIDRYARRLDDWVSRGFILFIYNRGLGSLRGRCMLNAAPKSKTVLQNGSPRSRYILVPGFFSRFFRRDTQFVNIVLTNFRLEKVSQTFTYKNKGTMILLIQRHSIC